MLNYVNYRMRVVIKENRTLVGTLMAFDKHMNLILGDCEEFRRIKSKSAAVDANGAIEEREEKNTLGLVLLRGENIISLQIEGPPPQDLPTQMAAAGPGVSRVAGRGMPAAPLNAAPQGLAGPVRGLGGPGASLMTGQVIASAPVTGSRASMPMGMPPMGMPPRPGMMPPGMPTMGVPPRPGMMPPGMPMMGMPPRPGMIPGAPRPPAPQ